MPVLPEYALFVLNHHLEDFARKGIGNLLKSNPDTLKMLRVDEEKLFDFMAGKYQGFLEALSENRAIERIKQATLNLQENSPEINHAFFSPKNITFAYSAQRQALISFMFLFTRDEETIFALLEEIDFYYTHAVSFGYERVISMMDDNISRQNKELEWLNNNLEQKILDKTVALEDANRLLNHITDNVPALISLISKDLKFIFANKTSEEWFGAKRIEIIGKEVKGLVGETAFQKAMPAIKKALKGKEVHTEEEIPFTNIGNRIADIRIKPTYHENEIDGFIVLLTDITEAHLTRLALAKSEKKLRTLAESIPLKVWSLSPMGEVDYVNQAWFDYSGLNLEETRKNPFSTIHSEDIPIILETWKKHKPSGEAFEFEARFRSKKDGLYRWHLVRNTPLKDSGQQLIQWFGTSLDIHEQKVNEQRKDDFIGIAGHELKTPLTSLKAYVELLLEEQLGDVQRKYLHTINNQVRRLEKLVSDLLDVTKINSESLILIEEEIKWEELVESAMDTIRSTSPSHRFRIDKIPDVKVYGDRDRLLQVLVNLLSNAVKYSPDGSEVVVNFDKGNGKLTTSIIDKGIGIKDTELERVFTKFYRAQNPMSKTQGLGIGLYIAKQIVNLHKGEIKVKSEYGSGSEFSILLPHE